MNIPLLADKSMAVSRAYGVLNEEAGISFRGLFVIDGNSVLRQITVNDLPVGRSVDETLRLVQAFQYTDTHGEVCPANWRPGSKTMVADTTKSKEYFNTVN
jgi:peroxiredoxin 1